MEVVLLAVVLLSKLLLSIQDPIAAVLRWVIKNSAYFLCLNATFKLTSLE